MIEGWIIFFLRDDGNILDSREVLIIEVMVGVRVLIECLSILVGVGFNIYDLVLDFIKSLLI